MSRHVSRKERWTQIDAKRHRSSLGEVVYDKNGWYAVLPYRTLAAPAEGALLAWEQHRRRLGPFKRPRNAMVALEQEANVLKNRHGDNLVFGD
jgi:hypothetical protein